MKTVTIQLNTVSDVKKFVSYAEGCPFDIDLLSGRYAVNGKSIMGILSLDLGQPIQVNIHDNEPKDFLDKVKNFIID